MPRSSVVYEILIASPSDVVNERGMLADVIADWNSSHSRTRAISLQALRWELDATPGIGERPQDLLNKHLVLLCYKKSRKQQGHLGRERARCAARCWRRVAMEDGL
jgi:hypothetical protein